MLRRQIVRTAMAAICGLALLATTGFAAGTLEKPSDEPMLTVSGKIQVTNGNGAAQFDRKMLESIGMVSFSTQTPWYKEPVKFEGVPLAKLMEMVGADGEKVAAIALNDYSAEIPMEDIKKYGVILALKRDGEYMSVREKGPLFIVYPFDSNPELKAQKYYSRSVWQVAKLEVR